MGVVIMTPYLLLIITPCFPGEIVMIYSQKCPKLLCSGAVIINYI